MGGVGEWVGVGGEQDRHPQPHLVSAGDWGVFWRQRGTGDRNRHPRPTQAARVTREERGTTIHRVCAGDWVAVPGFLWWFWHG
jgi:hypothetical protein